MELVSWKTENKNTNKVTFSVKIWEKYRNTKKSKIIEKSASSKFILMIKINWWNMINFNKL